MKTTLYPSRKIRLILTITASIYIVLHGRLFDLFRAISSIGFYVALSASLAIGLLMSYIVHRGTVWMDKRCSWKVMPMERLVLQLSIGIVLPLAADIFLISFYFEAIGQNVLDNQFFLIDFPVISFFTISLNVIYFLYYILRETSQGAYAYSKIQSYNHLIKNLELKQNDETQYQVYTSTADKREVDDLEILFVARSDKKIQLVRMDRSIEVITISVANFIKEYDHHKLLQINRGTIINPKIIKGYNIGSKRYTLQVIIVSQYQWILEILSNHQLLITKEFMEPFKLVFKNLDDSQSGI